MKDQRIEQPVTKPKIVTLWSAPGSVSSALLKDFSQRPQSL